MTKKQKGELTRKITIVVGRFEPTPNDAGGYFKKLEKQKICFFFKSSEKSKS